MRYKIVVDSCGELLEEWKKDERFESIPLVLMVGEETIIDDENFNQKDFLKKVADCPECPKSACPSPERYMRAFQCEAEHIYAVTLTSELSGSYNSAVLGKELLLEENPDKKIYVFNSRSASVAETLIALKIQECEEQGMSFEDVIDTVERYISEQNTFFVLENLDTLRKNGRLTGVKSLVASALKVKPIMGATPEGTIYQLDQARGINKALLKMVDYVAEKAGKSETKVLGISHCNCPERAMLLKQTLEEKIKPSRILVQDMGGLSSLYANDGGVIVVV